MTDRLEELRNRVMILEQQLKRTMDKVGIRWEPLEPDMPPGQEGWESPAPPPAEPHQCCCVSCGYLWMGRPVGPCPRCGKAEDKPTPPPAELASLLLRAADNIYIPHPERDYGCLCVGCRSGRQLRQRLRAEARALESKTPAPPTAETRIPYFCGKCNWTLEVPEGFCGVKPFYCPECKMKMMVSPKETHLSPVMHLYSAYKDSDPAPICKSTGNIDVSIAKPIAKGWPKEDPESCESPAELERELAEDTSPPLAKEEIDHYVKETLRKAGEAKGET